MTKTFSVSTSARCQLLDITAQVASAVKDTNIRDGIVVVFVSHTTAGITINENADPDVKRDILRHFEKLIPENGDFRHGEGNSDAHIKAGLMGASTTIIITDGRLNLGTWQGIYFCEFDGPRSRTVWVKIIEG